MDQNFSVQKIFNTLHILIVIILFLIFPAQASQNDQPLIHKNENVLIYRIIVVAKEIDPSLGENISKDVCGNLKKTHSDEHIFCFWDKKGERILLRGERAGDQDGINLATELEAEIILALHVKELDEKNIIIMSVRPLDKDGNEMSERIIDTQKQPNK